MSHVVNNIKDDGCQTLPDNGGFPVINNGAFCFVGAVGTGKTTSMNKLLDAYKTACQKSTYDLNEPFLNNGPLTHIFYVSPSIKSDMTLLNGDTKEKILIEATKENIQALCQTIDVMRKEIYDALVIEKQIREILQNSKFKEDLTTYVSHGGNGVFVSTLLQIKNSLQVLHEYKAKYQKLIVPEKDKEMNALLKRLHQALGINVPDGYVFTWLRRQRVALLLDDISCCYDITQTSSPLFGLFTCRRHLGIMLICCCVHTYTSIYSQFRQQLNGIAFMQGIKTEHIKLAYEDVCRLQTPSFQNPQWLELYNKSMGLNLESYTERKKYKYNFILVIIYPDTQIRLGFTQILRD